MLRKHKASSIGVSDVNISLVITQPEILGEGHLVLIAELVVIEIKGKPKSRNPAPQGGWKDLWFCNHCFITPGAPPKCLQVSLGMDPIHFPPSLSLPKIAEMPCFLW